MTSGVFERGAIPIGAGILFIGASGFCFVASLHETADAVGFRAMGACFLGLGAIAMLVGIRSALFHLEYRNRLFHASPGNRTYTVADVQSWVVIEDPNGDLYKRRHVELRFDRWYRRYMIFERDMTPHEFDVLVRDLDQFNRRVKDPCDQQS